MRATRARGSKHVGDSNQFLGVVELPEGAIVELELGIDRKPANMRSTMLIEAELVEQIDKYLYSSHKRDNFGGLVQSSDFARSTIDMVLMAGGRSDSKIHANSNSKASSTTLLD